MKNSISTEEQIAYALRLADSGMPMVDVFRQIGMSVATFYAKQTLKLVGRRELAA